MDIYQIYTIVIYYIFGIFNIYLTNKEIDNKIQKYKREKQEIKIRGNKKLLYLSIPIPYKKQLNDLLGSFLVKNWHKERS